MNERLLCKCANSGDAHTVTSALESDGIAFRQHDEVNAPHMGMYGTDPGIAIYVLEEDDGKASALVEPIINPPEDNVKPFCPKCGSEDTLRIGRSSLTTPLLLLSISLFVAPCVYLYCTKGTEIRLTLSDSLAIMTFISGIVVSVVCEHKNICLGWAYKFMSTRRYTKL